MNNSIGLLLVVVVVSLVVVVVSSTQVHQIRPTIPTTFYAEVRVTYQVGQLGEEHESFVGGGMFVCFYLSLVYKDRELIIIFFSLFCLRYLCNGSSQWNEQI